MNTIRIWGTTQDVPGRLVGQISVRCSQLGKQFPVLISAMENTPSSKSGEGVEEPGRPGSQHWGFTHFFRSWIN